MNNVVINSMYQDVVQASIGNLLPKQENRELRQKLNDSLKKLDQLNDSMVKTIADNLANEAQMMRQKQQAAQNSPQSRLGMRWSPRRPRSRLLRGQVLNQRRQVKQQKR